MNNITDAELIGSKVDLYLKDQARDPMLLAAKACQAALDACSQKDWAALFVELKMAFFRLYGRGLICSTEHGTNYFRNIIGVATGTLVWEEKGSYGDNFRKMVKERPVT